MGSLLSGKGQRKLAKQKQKERTPAESQREPHAVAVKCQIKDEITQFGERISEVNISLKMIVHTNSQAEAYQATGEYTALHHR